MKSLPRSLLKSTALRTALAIAAATVCVGASAQTFTFTPAAASLVGTAFTADNLITSDFSKVTLTSTGFTEYGYLPVTAAQLGGSFVATTGLGSSYGLVIEYSGTGVNDITSGTSTSGHYDTLTYSLIGYTGNFDFTGAPATGPTGTVLATGKALDSSYTFGTTAAGNSFFSTSVVGSFSETAAGVAALSPQPFYTSGDLEFGHKNSDFSISGNVVTLKQGSGSVSFIAAAVPEPETYALMLGGLAAIGFVARRRNRG